MTVGNVLVVVIVVFGTYLARSYLLCLLGKMYASWESYKQEARIRDKEHKYNVEREISMGSRRYSIAYTLCHIAVWVFFIYLCTLLPGPIGVLAMCWQLTGMITCPYIGRDFRPHKISIKGFIYWFYAIAWWPKYLKDDSQSS